MNLLNHSFNKQLLGSWDIRPIEFNQSFITRLCNSFQQYQLYNKDPDIWNAITNRHALLINGLNSNSHQEVHNYLSHMFDTELGHGILLGDICAGVLRGDVNARQYNLAIIFDRLLSLAEYFGVIPTDSPEQGDFTSYANLDPSYLVAHIGGKIQFNLPRWQGGAWLLQTESGLMSDKDIQGAYVADKVAHMFHNKNITICEIGGGFGHTAYHLYQNGFRDITIVDLPTISVAQGFFLANNISPDKVSMMGEDDNEINLRNPFYFGNIRNFDLVINIDSLPEMGDAIAQDYINKISDMDTVFYSINQEASSMRTANIDSQTPVSITVGNRMKCWFRNKFWLRNGYVEELYKSAI